MPELSTEGPQFEPWIENHLKKRLHINPSGWWEGLWVAATMRLWREIHWCNLFFFIHPTMTPFRRRWRPGGAAHRQVTFCFPTAHPTHEHPLAFFTHMISFSPPLPLDTSFPFDPNSSRHLSTPLDSPTVQTMCTPLMATLVKGHLP